MRAWLDAIRRSVLDVLVPPICASCGRPGVSLLCERCRIPALPALDVLPSGLDDAIAGVAHSGAAAAWMARFKYPQPGLRGLDPAAEAVVRSWVLDAATRQPWRPDAIVPVPLHASARHRHGLDPPRVLAEALAHLADRPVPRDCVVRVRDTPSQTGLGRSARRQNVRGAFEARATVPARIWLVDDVVTTGATLSACAAALRGGGATEIRGLCAAFRPLRID